MEFDNTDKLADTPCPPDLARNLFQCRGKYSFLQRLSTSGETGESALPLGSLASKSASPGWHFLSHQVSVNRRQVNSFPLSGYRTLSPPPDLVNRILPSTPPRPGAGHSAPRHAGSLTCTINPAGDTLFNFHLARNPCKC